MRYLSFALLMGMAPFCSAADADVVRQFGMLGRQALACAAPPSASNPHVTYAASPQGSVTRTLRLGVQADGPFNLRNVRIAGPGMLQFEEIRQNGDVMTVTVAKFDGKFRSWRSVTADGTVLIAEGKRSSSRMPTLAFTPCR